MKKSLFLSKLFLITFLVVVFLGLYLTFFNITYAYADEGDGDRTTLSQLDYIPDWITEENITQLIEENLLCSGTQTTKYREYYGYIINSKLEKDNSYLNNILFFDVSFDNDDDGYGFSITIKPLKEVCVKYTNGTIEFESIDSHIGIGNVRIGAQIINQESAGINEGAFFTSTNYYSTSTQYTGEYPEEFLHQAKSVSISLMLGAVGYASVFPIVGDAAGILANTASLVYTMDEAHKAVQEAKENNWVTNLASNNTLFFAPSKIGQLNDSANNNSLVKGVVATETLDTNEILSLGENAEENFSTMHYRFNNEDDIGFYALSSIEFSIYSYCDVREAIYLGEFSKDIIYDYSQLDTKVERVIKNNEGYEFDRHINILPALSNKSFIIECDKTGYYQISSCFGYSGEFAGQVKTNKGYYLQEGCRYRLFINKDECQFVNHNDTAQSLFFAEDFYLDEIAFVPVLISENQSVELNENTIPGISYYMVTPTENNCDLFKLEEVNSSETSLSIYDGNFNKLCQGYSYRGGVYCNYPMLINNTYYIVIDTKESVCFCKDLELGILDYQIYPGNGNVVYYEYYPKYSTKYNITGNAVCSVYSDEMEIVSETDGYYLLKDEQYFLKAENQVADVLVEFDSSYFTTIYINEEKPTQTNALTNVFLFNPPLSGTYSFCGLRCDVYKNLTLYAEDVTTCHFNAGSDYKIVSNEVNSSLIIQPIESIIGLYDLFKFDDNGSQIYRFETNSQIIVRLHDNETGYRFLNQNFVSIDYCHGFDLAAGYYYLVIDNLPNGMYYVEESNDVVSALLLDVDGKSLGAIDLIYGKPIVLPIQYKMGYDFNGWAWANNINLLVTDENGESNTRLLVDVDVAFVALFVAQSLTMQVDIGNLEIRWWTGEEIVEVKPIKSKVDLIEQISNLKKAYTSKSYGKRVGEFLSDFEIMEDENDPTNYIFKPKWVKEKYIIRVHYGYDSELLETVLIYDEPISGNWFVDESKIERYLELTGWQYGSVDFIPKQSLAYNQNVPDFTPGIASDYEDEGIPIVDVCSVVTDREYLITINNKSFTMTYNDSYTFKEPSEYGYSESLYNGCNIWYSVQNKKYYVNSDPLVQVDSNLTINLEKKAITVSLTYSANRGNNPTTYNLTNSAVKLSACTEWDRQYKIEWSISELSRQSLFGKDLVWYSESNPVLTKNVGINRTFDLSKSVRSNISISVDSKTVDIFTTSSKALRNVSITINPSVERITFEGNGKTWMDVRIDISPRTTKLYMNFKNHVSLVGWSSKCIIDAKECPDVDMYSYDSTSLASGELGILDPEPGAILCQKLKLSGDYFRIYVPEQEANLSMGFNGTSGIYNGYNANATIIIDCEIDVVAGDGMDGTFGSNGKDGSSTGESGKAGSTGGKGGDGGYGINTIGRIEFTANASGYVYGGNGGTGGKGGKGGNGAGGRNGSFGTTTIDPGNGGNGGDGGKGGNAGHAIKGTYTNNSSNMIFENGTRGEGGEGGSGGNRGATSYTMWHNPRNGTAGKNGNKGAPGNN